MTPTQLIALERIAGGDCHPHGKNVIRVVRVLAAFGYVTLRDYGRTRGAPGGDKERWCAELTEKGKMYLVGLRLATKEPA